MFFVGRRKLPLTCAQCKRARAPAGGAEKSVERRRARAAGRAMLASSRSSSSTTPLLA